MNMAAQKTKKPAPKSARKPVTKKAPGVASTPAPVETAASTPPKPETGLVVRKSVDMTEIDARIAAFEHSCNTDSDLYVVRASQAPNPYFLRRPTGIIDLDIDLGGGFPAGGCCFISGPDNSGKTFLMLRAMGWQQRLFGPDCRMAYAITEGAFPYGQAINAGMRVYVPTDIINQWQEWRHLRGMPLLTGEQVAELQREDVNKQLRIMRAPNGEALLSIMLEAIKTNAFSVIACDSLNGLQPSGETGKEMTDAEKVAAQSTLIGKFFKKYVPITTGFTNQNTTTVLFTQQVRANQDRASAPSYMQKWIPQFVSSGGGWSGRHYKLIGLGLEDGKLLKNGEKEVIGKMLGWHIEKGKAGTHDNKSGDVAFYYNIPGGVDEIGELISAGIKRGLIQTHNKQTIVVRPDDRKILTEFNAPNLKVFRKLLEVDFDLELALRREILSHADKPCLYR